MARNKNSMIMFLMFGFDLDVIIKRELNKFYETQEAIEKARNFYDL